MREFKKLDFPRLREYYTKYPQGYTIYESLLDILEHINDITDTVNLTLSQWEQIETWVLTELKQYSIDQLQTWLEDGTLEQVINEALLNLDARIIQVTNDINQLDQKVDDYITNMESRGVLLSNLDFNFDGTDELIKLRDALSTYKHVIIPAGKTVSISDTLVLFSNETLEGEIQLSPYSHKNSTLKYIGAEKRDKAVIRMGAEVESNPLTQASSVILKNVIIDADYKLGFGFYGTYISNDSVIENVTVKQTNEYAFYIAKSWYAHFNGLFALSNKGKGISIGLPILYDDGTQVDFTGDYAYECNAAVFKNLRIHNSGQNLIENPNTFSLENYKRGAGLLIGKGKGLVVENYTIEGCGGIGLYVYSETWDYARTLLNGYLENNVQTSTLPLETTRPAVILEADNISTKTRIETLFLSSADGGVYYKGEAGNNVFTLINVWRGTFLKSLSGLDNQELHASIEKINCWYQLGVYNTDLSQQIPFKNEQFNTRYASSEIELPTGPSGYWAIYAKKVSDDYYGTLSLRDENDNVIATLSFPELTTTEFKLVGNTFISARTLKYIRKGGNTGSVDGYVELSIRYLQQAS